MSGFEDRDGLNSLQSENLPDGIKFLAELHDMSVAVLICLDPVCPLAEDSSGAFPGNGRLSRDDEMCCRQYDAEGSGLPERRRLISREAGQKRGIETMTLELT